MSVDPLLQTLTNAAEIGMVLLDHDRRIRLWNRWMASASGIEAWAALGREIDVLFPAIATTRIAPSIDQALRSGLSAMLSSTLNKSLFPLMRDSGQSGRAEPMHQIVVISPLDDCGRRCCLIQVFDVSPMAARESVLRRQALTMEALAENYRLSELHGHAIVNNTADAIVTFGEDGAIGTFNHAAEGIFGYTAPEVTRRTIARLIPELADSDGRLRPSPFIDRRTEVTGWLKNGTQVSLELSLSAMEMGGRTLFIAIGHDITARKEGEEELRQQKEWLSTLINAMPDMVCFKDGHSRWLVANQTKLSLLGLVGRDYVGRTDADLARLTPEAAPALLAGRDSDERAWQDGRPLMFETAMNTRGEQRIFDMIKLPLFNPDGSRRGLVEVGRDITERKLNAARIHHLAHHDPLTELPNRTLFQERLRLALAQARRAGNRLALLFLDLDKFKDINDTLGHDVGDLLLRAVAQRLNHCLRETDTVARLGGDEFAVILTNLADANGAACAARTINTALGEPFRLNGHDVLTSTSIGITLFPDDASAADQLLKNADLAMFHAKAEGRNGYHFYLAEMDRAVQARKETEQELRQAMGTDQVLLHYQPLIDLKAGRIVGCEALLRWRHPVRGWVPPSEFIPIVERTDLISPLGRWVLHRACLQGSAWQRDGLGQMMVAVNLSPAQFKHGPSLVTMVADILDQTGFPAEYLQLEITEGIAMTNIDATIDVLRALRDMGVRISIDDFGTGYSSLNYLKRFPVDKLKIDRSFVVDIGLHPDNAAVVKAIVDLGHSLGTRVNVEGVESRPQLDFLCEQGVDEAQGYLFSPALPPDTFAELAREKRDWLL